MQGLRSRGSSRIRDRCDSLPPPRRRDLRYTTSTPTLFAAARCGCCEKVGGNAIKPSHRTARLGLQARALQVTPKEVVFRDGFDVSTPLGWKLKSLALWTRIFILFNL